MLALAGIVLLLVVASVLAFAALAGARAVTQGESNWTRTQKDLVIGMERYARTGDRAELARAREAEAFHRSVDEVLTLVEGRTASRAELQAATGRVEGFQGEAGPFARAFVWFRGFEVVDVVTREWGAAQGRVSRIAELLDPLEAAVESGDDATIDAILQEVAELDGRVDAFRERFIEASDRWAGVALQGSRGTILILGLLLVLLGSLGLFSVLRRLDASERALEESRDRFRQVTEGIREVFWLSSPDKATMYYVSPAYEQVWGEPVEAASATFLGWAQRVLPEDRERVLEAVERQRHGEVEIEYRIRDASGRVRWIRERAFPVRDVTGQVTRIAGISEDVTERKSLEEELLQAHKLRSVARLAGSVGHEFNNLLTAIRSHVAFLEQDLEDHPTSTPDLDGISQAAERAEALTRKLLAFGRQQIVLPERLPLQDLVRDIQPLLGSILPPRIRLSVQVDAELPDVRADRGHLREAFLALVTNSRDAIAGEGSLRIHVRALCDSDRDPQPPHGIPVEGGHLEGDGYVVIEIEDDGPGIEEALRHRIFEPFHRGRGGAASPGLGLPAVLGLMDQMGGGIRLESRVDEGTSVRLFLPADRPGPGRPDEEGEG
jgi:PAS domain S-box-containing protein